MFAVNVKLQFIPKKGRMLLIEVEYSGQVYISKSGLIIITESQFRCECASARIQMQTLGISTIVTFISI